MLSKSVKIRCGWCDNISSAKDWNDNTYSECKSRAMRREYVPIYKKSTFYRRADTFYKCPQCSTWSRGCQLTVLDENGDRLKGLGGEPIFKDVTQNTIHR